MPDKTSHRYDLILLSSSLNEIGEGADVSHLAQQLAEIGKFLKPSGFLLIIEPALKTTCQRLHQAAAKLVKISDLYLQGPYFNGAPCPFASSKSRYHSHEVRRVTPPEIVRKLNEPLGLSIRELKFGFVLLSQKKLVSFEESASILRMVSPATKKKGMYRFFGIGGDAKERRYEIQTRDLAAQDFKVLEKLERGDVLRLLDFETLDEGHRIRIPNGEAIDMLWKPE